MNTLTFNRTYFFLTKFIENGAKEGERHDLGFQKLQRARYKWINDRME